MKNVHHLLVFKRRVEVLSTELADRLPENARVLDIGCGSGDMALAIMAKRPDITITGVDVLARPGAAIEVQEYDGASIPCADNSYHIAMLVDVLHHTDDPRSVLAEAARVASQGVLVKDHYRDTPLDGFILRLMDWVGNASHGVRLPYNYLARKQWQAIWLHLGLIPDQIAENLGIYPMPFELIFGRGLHFVALLRKGSAGSSGELGGTKEILAPRYSIASTDTPFTRHPLCE